MNGKAGTKLKNNLDRREVKSAMITCDIKTADQPECFVGLDRV